MINLFKKYFINILYIKVSKNEIYILDVVKGHNISLKNEVHIGTTSHKVLYVEGIQNKDINQVESTCLEAIFEFKNDELQIKDFKITEEAMRHILRHFCKGKLVRPKIIFNVIKEQGGATKEEEQQIKNLLKAVGAFQIKIISDANLTDKSIIDTYTWFCNEWEKLN